MSSADGRRHNGQYGWVAIDDMAGIGFMVWVAMDDMSAIGLWLAMSSMAGHGQFELPFLVWVAMVDMDGELPVRRYACPRVFHHHFWGSQRWH